MVENLSSREHFEVFIKALIRATNICGIYGASHELSLTHIESLENSLQKIFKEKNEVTFAVIGKEIVFDKLPYFELSKLKQEFIQKLTLLGIQQVTFHAGVNTLELVEFLNVLSKKVKSQVQTEQTQKFLTAKNVKHITVNLINTEMPEDDETTISKDNLTLTKQNFLKSLDFLNETLDGTRANKHLDLDSLRQVTSGLIHSMLMNKNLLMLLATIKIHDHDMLLHNVNTCIFTMTQAEMLGLEKKYIEDIASTALLHNLGNVLQSPEEEENSSDQKANIYNTVKMLIKMENTPPLAVISAYEHVLPFDNEGTFRKYYGEGLNLVSMMIAISKTYDNLRRKHHNDNSFGPEKVYEEMNKLSGKKFHPDLLANFFAVLGVFPPGTLVELDTGEIGIVVQANIHEIHRPRVEILYNTHGEKIEHPIIADLTERTASGKYKWTIMKSITPSDKFQIPKCYTN